MNVTVCACRQLQIRQGGVVSCSCDRSEDVAPSMAANHPNSSMVIGRASGACSLPFGTVPVKPSICQKFQLMILATVVSSFSVGPLCHMLCRYSTKVMSTLILAISRLSP